MKITKRMEKLEDQFIDYSDRVQGLVFFIRGGHTGNMRLSDLREMKKGLLDYLDEMMSADQKYTNLLDCLLGETDSHPNYDKFMTYMGIARLLLNNEIAKRNSNM